MLFVFYFRYGFILKYFGFNFFYLNINFNMLCCLVDLFMEERNFVELFISIVRIIKYCIFEVLDFIEYMKINVNEFCMMKLK